MFKKVVLQEGVALYIRHSEQFKTINLSVKFKSALIEKSAAARAVLANVLEDSNAKYRTQSELRSKLDELYGTVLYTDVAKRSDLHILSLYIECVNDEYLSDKGVFDEVLSLLKTVIFEPNQVDGKFDEATVNREKRSVKERIRSQYDDKTRYAQKRMLEILRPNDPASASANGSEIEVDALSSDDLIKAYKQLLFEDEISIYVVGNVNESEVIEKLQTTLQFQPRPTIQKKDTLEKPNEKVENIQRVREKQDMKQGKLHLGFSTTIHFTHEDYTKMQVTNGVFGGFAHSKLFINVREKESMAYYASSSYASHYGLIYVMAGIDAELEDKAVKLIRAQLDALQKGEITDLELEQTKALLKNSITSTFDSARGQIEVFDQFKQLDENFSADYLISKWESVTKEDVKEMANTIQLEIVYLLSGKEDNSNE